MTLNSSTMLILGTPAPDFSLPDVRTGETVTLDSFSGKSALLVMFLCCHCPFVRHIQRGLVQLGVDYMNRNTAMVAISSNDPLAYPEDSPSSLKKLAASLSLPFPLCFDESQEAAKAFQAACTPDFFLYNRSRRLFYRGQFDSSRPGNGLPVTGEDLRMALEAVLAGRPAPTPQKPSVGCSIKWKAGRTPMYA